MNVFVRAIVLIQLLFVAQFSLALDATEKAWVKSLASGDVSQIRRAAEQMYTAGVDKTELLDVVAEVILDSYDMPPSGYIQVDALSWGTRVLGASRDWRYNDVLTEVETNAYHKKLRKFAKKNRTLLQESDVAQYKKGGVSLKNLRGR